MQSFAKSFLPSAVELDTLRAERHLVNGSYPTALESHLGCCDPSCECRSLQRGSSPLSSSSRVVKKEREGKVEEMEMEMEMEEPVALAVIGRRSPVAYHTLGSLLASTSSTFVFYPFDFLRTRFMSQDGTIHRQHNGQTYSSLLQSLRAILREEGARALFRGWYIAVWGSALAWGVYMSIYRQLCNLTEFTSYPSRFLLSMVASTTSCLISNPFFLIKSRMQLEETTKGSSYRTFRSGIRHATRTSGVLSLWRGTSLQLLLSFPNSLNLPTYDYLKSLILRYRWQHTDSSPDLSNYEIAACSATTKILILILSHPIMTLRVRLQDHRSRIGAPHYVTAPQALMTVLRMQGIHGLYRGFYASIFHTLPRSMMYYFVYEETLSLLCKRKA
ncbi:unnamed protein product [Phytomonas sp. EM1]|nr:unnamed protein product [Phytomonas sp. EM1]|eukprot:CCW62775.1 unnamed protein product [Phytomonas sp. isolate EM1]